MNTQRLESRFSRRAAVVPLVAISGTLLMGFAALAIDVSVLYNVRTETQRSADAGALAGAWKLLNEDRLKGGSAMDAVVCTARSTASSVATGNKVFGTNPMVDPNPGNSPSGDVVLGRLNDFSDRTEALNNSVEPGLFNTVGVSIHRDGVRNGPIPLFFAQIFGRQTQDVSAKAYAGVQDGRVAGYKVTSKTGNAQLLPLSLHVDVWNQLMAGTFSTGDNYAYNSQSKTVSCGSDGVRELDIYPGSGTNQLPPGNFGTVDIGNPNNSTSDISRQIRDGVSEADLAFFGGELKFDSSGYLYFEGDTGLSAAIKDDLSSIIGMPRAIPLFDRVSGNGNNSVYRVVGFAGIRVLAVTLTGSMKSKKVIIQPAVVVDDAATVVATDTPSKYFVYEPPQLIR